MAGESNPDKFVRENLKDLQEVARRRLAAGRKPEHSEKADIEDWNINNWGNFYDADFYNH